MFEFTAEAQRTRRNAENDLRRYSVDSLCDLCVSAVEKDASQPKRV